MTEYIFDKDAGGTVVNGKTEYPAILRVRLTRRAALELIELASRLLQVQDAKQPFVELPLVGRFAKRG